MFPTVHKEQERQQALQFLLELLPGISKESAREALERSNYDIYAAMEYHAKQTKANPPITGTNPTHATHNPVATVRPHVTSTPEPTVGGGSSISSVVNNPSSTNVPVGPQRPPHLAPSTGGAILSEEEQLQQALQLSLADQNRTATLSKEEADLQKALELSKHTAGVSGLLALGDDETTLSRVIEHSLQDAMSSGVVDPLMLSTVSTNPTYRKRDPATPVGLKNVGNTCYFNSLLQTYLFIPELRRAVLTFPEIPEHARTPQNADAIALMSELQRLFGALLYSGQKYVDPGDLLKKVVAKTGNAFAVGNQEDMSEFQDLFLQRIEEGLAAAAAGAAAGPPGLVRRLFYGEAQEIVSAREEDGTPVETSQKSAYSSLILPVLEGVETLYDSLDVAMATENVSYKTDRGFTDTAATKATWLTSPLPPLLMFLQSRVVFDPVKRTYVKRNSPLHFDTEISLDRYLLQHREATMAARRLVAAKRAALATTEKALRGFTEWHGRPHVAIDDALKAVLEYLDDRAAAADGVDGDMAAAKRALEGALQRETARMEQLRGTIGQLRGEIAAAYDGLPRQQRYHLFAAWIHQGVAGSGHYWAYIKYPASPARRPDKLRQWLKFNDMRVSTVDEADMLADAIGGNDSPSAYFLIYMSAAQYEQYCNQSDSELVFPSYSPEKPPDITTDIPAKTRAALEEDNRKFREALRQHDESQRSAKVESFVSRYDTAVKSAAAYAADATPERDMRLKSLYPFLESINMHEWAVAVLLRDLWAAVFECGIEVSAEDDTPTGYFAKVGEKVSREDLKRAVVLANQSRAGDHGPLRDIQNAFDSFRQAAYLYTSAASALLEHRYVDSARWLAAALQCDQALQTYPSVRKHDMFLRFGRVMVVAMVMDDRASRDLKVLETAVAFARQYLFPPATDLAYCAMAVRLKVVYDTTPEGPDKDRIGELLQIMSKTSLPPPELEVAPITSPPLTESDQWEALVKRTVELNARIRQEFSQPNFVLDTQGLLPYEVAKPSAPRAGTA